METSLPLSIGNAGSTRHDVTWFSPKQVQQLGATIDSPLSLLRNGGNFAVSSGGSTLSYFRSALDPVAAALAPRYPSSLPCPAVKEIVAAMPTWCLVSSMAS
jgi:hypothetical protein